MQSHCTDYKKPSTWRRRKRCAERERERETGYLSEKRKFIHPNTHDVLLFLLLASDSVAWWCQRSTYGISRASFHTSDYTSSIGCNPFELFIRLRIFVNLGKMVCVCCHFSHKTTNFRMNSNATMKCNKNGFVNFTSVAVVNHCIIVRLILIRTFGRDKSMMFESLNSIRPKNKC